MPKNKKLQPKKNQKNQPKKVRINPLVCYVVGSIGTRKSGVLADLIGKKSAVVFSNNYPDSNAVRVRCGEVFRIQLPTPSGVVVVAPSTDIEVNERVIDIISSDLRNSIIVLDDIRDWTNSTSRVKTALAILFGRCRKNNVDIIITCHSFRQIPSQLMDYKPIFVIKETSAPPRGEFLNEVRRPDEFLTVVNRVNSRAVSDPFYSELYNPF